MRERTPAERSMDELNARLRELITLSERGLTAEERRELVDVNRRVVAARRVVSQMRQGLR